MLAYYGYAISPNQIETAEGFLICRNVPIARTGDMEYLESELKPDGDSAKMVKVYRSPEEVFSEAALSSFEGKPVTDGHPPELLTPDTCTQYARGHAQNIRKGEGEWEGHVLADLHIQDEGLIREIQDGKREISCGYECSYVENDDGTYSQHEIRGNHIAIVARGRAGKHVAILDSNKKAEAAGQPERNGTMKKNSLFFKLFARAAKDASPEELETMAADAAAALDEGEAEPGPAVPAGEAPGEAAKDSASLDSKLDMIIELLGKGGKEPAAEDPLDSLIEKLAGGSGQPAEAGEAKVVPAGELDKASCTADRAAMAEVIRQIRPAIAGIKDDADRKAVTDSLVACLSDGGTANSIAKIAQAAQKNAAKLADQKPAVDLDAYQSAYDAMNPHKNGGTK